MEIYTTDDLKTVAVFQFQLFISYFCTQTGEKNRNTYETKVNIIRTHTHAHARTHIRTHTYIFKNIFTKFCNILKC